MVVVEMRTVQTHPSPLLKGLNGGFLRPPRLVVLMIVMVMVMVLVVLIVLVIATIRKSFGGDWDGDGEESFNNFC